MKPWWNLPRDLLAAQDRSAPENQGHHETCRTSLEPWRNLGGTLVNLGGTFRGTFWQPKTGLPPENHRESESKSAPKALLWLKAPKLLLLAVGE